MSDPSWTPAMARQDISNQVSEHNAAMADETYDRNNWDDWFDDRAPTPAEAEAQLFEDWCWMRDQLRNERQS